jgi:hypothetical protein
MDRRHIFAGIMVMVSSIFLLTGTALAHHEKKVEGPSCEIKTLPAFVDQGEFEAHSSVADIVEVHCNAEYGNETVKISSQELYNRCRNHLEWIEDSPYSITPGSKISKVKLDDDGNAVVAVEGGPECSEGESLISASMENSSNTSSVSEGFTVLAPKPTKPGVFALPSWQVEDGIDSSVATVVQVEFPSKYAEKEVFVSDEQLYTQCQLSPHLTWIGPSLTEQPEHQSVSDAVGGLFAENEEGVKLKLDNDGNAFVILLGEESCASGGSEIEASLEVAPYTTYVTKFNVGAPVRVFK